jgi:hypothetical protein
MPRVFVIPGLLSSELCLDPALSLVYWVNYGALFDSGIPAMELAADGVSPLPPDALQLYPGYPLRPWWATPLQLVAGQLKPHGYTVVGWGWDWRTDLFTVGRSLAALIRELVPAADPCSIIAHSTAGLVARVAWSELAKTAQTGLIRRIVALNTPDGGTWSVVAGWSYQDQVWDSFGVLRGIFAGAHPLPVWGGAASWTPARIMRAMMSWPCFYQLLPLVDPNDASAELLRRTVYEASSWTETPRPSQRWLDYSSGPWSTFLLSPDSVPPRHVLTNVYSSGYRTPAFLQLADRLGQPQCVGSSDQGDGVLTVESMLRLPSAEVRVEAAHSDVILATAQSGLLAQLVLDERRPADPPAVPQWFKNLVPVGIGLPPLESGPFVGAGNNPCWHERCSC